MKSFHKYKFIFFMYIIILIFQTISIPCNGCTPSKEISIQEQTYLESEVAQGDNAEMNENIIPKEIDLLLHVL